MTEGVSENQLVWVGIKGRGSGIGAPGVSMAIVFVDVPIVAAPLVVVFVVLPVRGGSGVMWAGSINIFVGGFGSCWR